MNRFDDRPQKKSLHVISNPVKGVTCFSIQEKYNVDCQRTSCPNWIENSKNNNCVIIAAQEGPKTLQEIGELFKLTRMRICQIEKLIYEKIKLSD